MAVLKQPNVPGKLSLRKKISDYIKLVKNKKKIYKEWESTWENDRKDFSEVYKDLVRLIWKYNVAYTKIFPGYWEEHMHKKGHPLEENVIWTEWNDWRSFLDWQCGEDFKKLYSKKETIDFFELHGIPCPSRIGDMVWNAEDECAYLELMDDKKMPLSEALKLYGGVFVKPDDLVQGRGCAKILFSEAGGCILDGKQVREAELAVLFEKNERLRVERLIIQHPAVGAFHPSSVNTLRLITMKEPSGSIVLSRSLLRMGIGGRSVDNWCTGGLAVKIHSNGCLDEYGWFEKPDRGPQTEHPDTKMVFKGYEMPYWKESVELVLHAHKTLVPDLFGVGWDVTITPTGPMLIEANPNFSIFQPICGGLRPIFEQYLKPMCQAVMNGKKPLIHYTQD